MKKTLLLCFILFFFIPLIHAYDLSFKDYMAINTDYYIHVVPYTLDLSVYLYISGDVYYMANDSYNYYTIVSSNVSEDVPFYVNIFNETLTIVNDSDGSRESDFTIINDTINYFYKNYTYQNITEGETEYHTICALLKYNFQSRNVHFFVGQTNATDNTQIVWQRSLFTTSVTSNSYQTYCSAIFQQYTENLTNNKIEYYGFQCDDCTDLRSISIGLDNSTKLNMSMTAKNRTAPISTHRRLYSGNFMITSTDTEVIPIASLYDILRFREPFNVDIYLYKHGGDNSSTELYKNDFNYLFLQFADSSTLSSDSPDAFSSGLNNAMDWIFGMTPTSKTIDTTLSFWGDYVNGKASITLYDTGNYSLNLETLKVKMPGVWKYEFIYPQYTDSQYYSHIVSFEISNATDQDISVYLDRYEISKSDFYLNIFYVIVSIIAYILLVVGCAIVTKNFLATGIIATIFLFILFFLIHLWGF